VIQIFIANLLSAQPIEHGFYGTYGRSTGSLAYFALSIFSIVAFLLAKNEMSSKLLMSFLLAGIFNLLYFALTLFGIEIFNWNNPSKSVLGTFGNSNFAGAFMGIFLLFLVSKLYLSKNNKVLFPFYLFLAVFAAFEVYKTRATQGIVVSGLGLFILGFFVIRSRSNKKIEIMYLGATIFVGIIAVLGMLQIGPLSQWLYKTSVSLRGGYWRAGWKMGLDNPLFGVGPDSYGFYYRKYRGQEIMDLAGPDTTTDAAHNVFLDIFAYGGFPLLIFYIIMQLIVLSSILRVLKKTRSFDPTFSVLVACWVAYQAQSVISINQIGVAIWGWILSGLIVGMAFRIIDGALEPSIKTEKLSKRTMRRGQQESDYSLLLGSIFGMAGLFVSIQPLLSDGAYFAALKKREIGAIEVAAKKWPTNPVRLGDATTIFSNNGFKEQSIALASYSIKKYPESYVAWFVYYTTPGLSLLEKEKALLVLKTLDPLNKELGKNIK
jgi:O-antigen ligase